MGSLYNNLDRPFSIKNIAEVNAKLVQKNKLAKEKKLNSKYDYH